MIAMKYTEEEYENNLEEIESEARDVVEDLIALYEESYYELNDWEKDFVRAMTNRPKMARMFFKRNREYGKARIENVDTLIKIHRKLLKEFDEIPDGKFIPTSDDEKLYAQIIKNCKVTYLQEIKTKAAQIAILLRLKKKLSLARLLRGLGRIKRRDFELYKMASQKSVDIYEDKYSSDLYEDLEINEYDINDFEDYIKDDDFENTTVVDGHNRLFRGILANSFDLKCRKDNYAMARTEKLYGEKKTTKTQ